MKAIILAMTLIFGVAKAEAPTDARLMCGTLMGKGAIHIPMPDGRFGVYVIDCQFKGLSA